MSNNRENEDKVTKIMGNYLLKGYRLLDTSCPNCQTPLMKSRSSDDYCIYCNEIKLKPSQQTISLDINSSNVCTNVNEMIEDIKENESKSKAQNDITIDSLNTNQIDLNENIGKTIAIVHKKIDWATNRLKNSNQITDCIQIINFIKSSADLLLTLNMLNQKQNTNN